MDLPLLLTILSSALFLTFFVVYNKDIIKWSIRPNLISWSLFSLITLINSLTYIFFTHNAFKAGLAFTDFFTCIVISCLILFRKQYSKPNTFERTIIVLAVVSLISRYLFHSALYANLLLQPAYILAFLPTIRNAWKHPQNESALVWLMWAGCFVLNITVIILLRNNVWADLVNPLIALTLHASVWSLALRRYG